MTPKQIHNKISRLKQKRTDVEAAIKAVQESCPHHNLFYQNQGSSGHWDREDSYWTQWHCTDCEKRWVTDQNYRAHRPNYDRATEIRNRY